MKPESQPFMGLVKAISFSLKQFRLYSANHPITKQTLQSLQAEITKYFTEQPKITLGSLKRRLLVNGTLVGEREPAANDLAKDFERLGIEGIIIEKNITMEEMTSFVLLMATRQKELQDKGGFRKVFEMKEFQSIKLSTGKFQLVEDGEVVARDDEVGEEGEAPGAVEEKSAESGEKVSIQLDRKIVGSVQEVMETIRDRSQNLSEPDEKIDLDAAKVVQELEKRPKDFVEAALKDSEDADQLEVTIRKTVHVLIDGLIGFLVEQGKDITKALDKLCSELEKALGKLGKGEAFDRLKEKLPQIFEDRTDELRISMTVKTFEEKQDIKAVQKIARKLFKDQETRKRLGPSLKEEMEAAGCSAEAVEAMLAEIEQKETTRKSKVSIDAEELEELRQKAALAESGVDREAEKEMQKLRIENKIMSSEKKRVESVIHNLAEGLVVVDKEGKVVLMNPAAEKLLGKKQNDNLGKPVTENVSGQHMVTMTQGELRDSAEGVADQVQTESPDEETKRVLQASTAVIENEDGQTVGMVSVLSDVTKQKELDQMKSKFVANVSHELRTPLVAIQKSLSLMLNKELGEVNEEQSKFLSLAERNIERLSRLINDLLDVSKLETRNITLKPSTYPMGGLVMQVVSTVETWAADKNIQLITDFQEGSLEADVDPDRVTQIVTNLIGNALKFTPDGGQVTVSIRRGIQDEELGPGEFMDVAVHDSGEGIEPEDCRKIFDKFVQVNVSQQHGVASTGLGLTIAREIVEMHSGKIWVESKPAIEGSRFVFRIPVEFRLNEKASFDS